MPVDAILDTHNRRLGALDPLLPPAAPLPAAEPDDVPIECPGGSGLARLLRVDLDSFAATWSMAEEHRLVVRVADPDAMADLLALWEVTVRDRATGDHDSEATLSWPSRDAAMVRVFLAHGMVPQVMIAVRPAGRTVPPEAAVPDVEVRPLRAGDVDAATRLWLEEVEWDQQFGGPVSRASTEPNLRSRLAEAAATDDPWSWVAERSGRLIGLVVVSPPAAAGWVSPLVAAEPAAYVDNLLVASGHRGSGVGMAMMRHVQAVLERSGAAATLLHYAALNPLSGPFWHRWGYRPLWTGWVRRPALGDPMPRKRDPG